MKKFLYLFYLVGFNSFGQVDSINSGTNNNNQAIPFNWVEQIPLLENCKLLEKNLQKDCMVSSLELHIKNTLQYPEEAKKVKVESKVFTSFIINKDGEITKLEVNGKPTSFKKAFENEARRIINALPKFIPGRHKNERVDVQVMLPVEFALEELKEKKIEVREVTSEPLSVEASDIAEEYLEDYAIPFAVVEQIPLFKSCKKKESNTQRDCFQEEIKKHIKKHLKYPKEAKKNKIEARVHVIFEIDNQGKTVNVKTRSNQKGNYGNLFEQESKRIISKLPNFTPAMQRGKAVKVSYIIPINFKL